MPVPTHSRHDFAAGGGTGAQQVLDQLQLAGYVNGEPAGSCSPTTTPPSSGTGGGGSSLAGTGSGAAGPVAFGALAMLGGAVLVRKSRKTGRRAARH